MTPIHSIIHNPAFDFRLQSSPVQRTRVPEDTKAPVAANIQQPPADQSETDLINQLPQDRAREVTDIFRSINIIANQALELGQNFESRESLQVEVEEDISELRSVFAELTQYDLTLFVAIFQNQLPGGLIDSGSTSDNSAFGLSFSDVSNDSLESLLNLDVTSEPGALTVLDLTGSVIDTLSANNSNSSLLESLLNDLTGSLINAVISKSLSGDQEPEETTRSSGNKTSQDFGTAGLNTQIPPLTPLDSHPPTIIDFAG